MGQKVRLCLRTPVPRLLCTARANQGLHCTVQPGHLCAVSSVGVDN